MENGEPKVIVNDEGARTTPSVVAYTKDGEMVDYLSTGLENSLMGIAFDDEGRLYAIDSAGQRVLRAAQAEHEPEPYVPEADEDVEPTTADGIFTSDLARRLSL